MSNQSEQTVVLADVRVTKSTDPATGQVFGGVYFPACTKNGKPQRARYETTIAINHRPYTDKNGATKEKDPTYIRIVAFSEYAGVLAKALTPGMEIIVYGKLESYEKRQFKDNQPVLDSKGNQITYTAVQLIVDKVKYHDASAGWIAGEIAAYTGQMNFTSRPKFWNEVGHVDNVTWKAIAAWRNAQVWSGGPSFGYARIIVPEGAVVTQLPGMVQQPVAGASPTDAAAQLANMASMMEMLKQQMAAMGPAAVTLTPEQKALADAKALIAKMAAAGQGEAVPF